MKHPRFALNSEQTLHLEELRATLDKALPAGAAETVELPVIQYGCSCGCTINYYVTCASACYLGCMGTCKGTCTSYCGRIAQ